jgi:hypothetical protein
MFKLNGASLPEFHERADNRILDSARNTTRFLRLDVRPPGVLPDSRMRALCVDSDSEELTLIKAFLAPPGGRLDPASCAIWENCRVKA